MAVLQRVDDQEAPARPRHPLRSGARAVLVPFVVSRLLADVLVVALSRHMQWPFWRRFGVWDGRWYRHIAQSGYPGLIGYHHQTGWAFFPLLPIVMSIGHALGAHLVATGVVANHLAFFVGLVGFHRLLSRRCSPTATSLAVWTLALFPASIVFSMVYPSAMFFAASVWAFVLLDEHRDLAAGGCAALATMARPNGFWIVVALALVVGLDRARLVRVCLAPCVALLAWLGYNQLRTGDPLRFWDAKAAWHEVTFLGLFGHVHLDALVHLALAALAVGLVLSRRSRIPRAWTAFTVLYVVPSLVLGIVGAGRYANECFPPFAVAGTLLERRSVATRAMVFMALVVAQVAFAYWILDVGHVP